MHAVAIVCLISSAVLATAGMARAEPVVLALGDSLTAGYGLPAGSAYPEVLERLLDEAGVAAKVVNAGVSGDTAADGLARLDWALGAGPELAIVALGANDGLRGMPVADMEKSLTAILERLKERGVKVILAGMVAPGNWGGGYAREFAAVFPRLADKYGATLYPFLLEGVAGDRSLNLPDGVHPNAAGARRIAEGLLPVVRGALR